MPGAGHRPPAAGREPLPGQLHRGGGGHPLRSRGGEGHRPELYPEHGPGAGGKRPLHQLPGLLRADVRQRHEQAGRGEPHLRRGLRLLWGPAQPAGLGQREAHRCHRRQPPPERGGADGLFRHRFRRRAPPGDIGDDAGAPGVLPGGTDAPGAGGHGPLLLRPPHGRLPGRGESRRGGECGLGERRLRPGGGAGAVPGRAVHHPGGHRHRLPDPDHPEQHPHGLRHCGGRHRVH